MKNKYYSTGITISPVDVDIKTGDTIWKVSASFVDKLFCNHNSTEGEMSVRYQVTDLVQAVKTLKDDMESLGIVFGIGNVKPTIYIPNDSENPHFDACFDDIDMVCKALGWENIYKRSLV